MTKKATKAAKAAALKTAPRQSNSDAVKDMYANPVSNTGAGTSSAVNGGYYFPYRISLDYMTLLALYRGSWICRAIIDTVPEDMLKEFPTITCQVTPEDISSFNQVIAKTVTMQKLVEGLKWGRLFGGAIGIIILSGDDQRDLSKPLVLDEIEPNSYRGLIIVDRWSGVSPSGELISNIDNPAEYGLPAYYNVTTEVSQNFRVHHSRALRFTGRDLPLFEKQIQTYWGMSELEAVFQELQRRDFVESGIADLVSRAHVLIMKEPMLAQMLSGVNLTTQQYQDYILRLRAVSESISTNGILALGEDGEIQAQSYSFAGLRDVHDACMENIAGAAGIPMSRLGRDISGLGNSGEGSLQIYYDTTDQKRKREVSPILDKLLPIICMSTWGEVPEDFGYRYAPVRTMTAKERAELSKAQTEPIFEGLNNGVIGRQTTLRELKGLSTENGLFTNITDEMIEEANDDLNAADVPPLGPEEGDNAGKGDEGAKDASTSLWARVRRVLGLGAKDSTAPGIEAKGTRDDVAALMEYRSFSAVGKDAQGDLTFQRGKNDRVVLVRFDDNGVVADATLTQDDGWPTGKRDRRSGWKGLMEIASAYGD